MPPAAEKNIEKSDQTNADPILSRTQHMPADSRFRWYSGTMGTSGVGPSTYWIDAEVTVPEQQAREWRELCSGGEPATPEVVDELRRKLTADDFIHCPELAGIIGTGEWTTRTWLSQSKSVLVLTLVGEG